MFGAPQRDDALYQAISEGRRFAGMEHWLPLFYDRLETVFDHAGGMPVVFDHLVHEALTERHTMVVDHYEARLRQAEGKEAGSDAVPYKPVKPETLYLTPQAVEDAVQASGLRIDLTPFGAPEVSNRTIVHADAHKGRNFAEERAATDVNLFEAAVKHIADLRASGKKVLVAAWTEGSLDRLLQVLDEHGLEKIETVDRLSTVKARVISQSLPNRIFSEIVSSAGPSVASAIRISSRKWLR
jgi:transcription-repair coupling factor (superfamily II helicase)